jgi:hypothetical protein
VQGPVVTKKGTEKGRSGSEAPALSRAGDDRIVRGRSPPGRAPGWKDSTPYASLVTRTIARLSRASTSSSPPNAVSGGACSSRARNQRTANRAASSSSSAAYLRAA